MGEEEKREEKSERKVVGRGVAVALGVICVILVAGLAGAVVNYTSIINMLNATLASKNEQIQLLTNQTSQLQTWLQGNITYYESQLDTLQSEYDNYRATHSHSDSEFEALQSEYNAYRATHSYTNEEFYALEEERNRLREERDALKAPKLISVDLKYEDIRSLFGLQPYLHVYGHVCNVGTDTAYNCQIHVVAYQSDGVKVIDKYIDLGTIDGESWKHVDASIHYEGNELVDVTLTLEWTESP